MLKTIVVRRSFDTRTGQPIIIDRPGAYPPDTTTLAPAHHWTDGTARHGSFRQMCWHNILSVLKQSKFEEINQWRDEQELAGIIFEWNGHPLGWRSDVPCPVITGISSGQSRGIACRFFWTDADNQDVAVTAEELIELEVQMLQAMVSQGISHS